MDTNPHRNPLADLGYEREELPMKLLGKVTFVFFFVSIVLIAISYGIFIGFVKAHNPDALDLAKEQAKTPFINKLPPAPNPILQTNRTAKTDMADLRNAEEKAMKTPAWVDKATGKVRMPVDEAIDDYVEKGGKGESF
ncbi:MAG: hypothetical protein JST35_09515 [Armatimonadetes bacterium]|nr:hypothetical protein [Armatimonadota bacterium]